MPVVGQYINLRSQESGMLLTSYYWRIVLRS